MPLRCPAHLALAFRAALVASLLTIGGCAGRGRTQTQELTAIKLFETGQYSAAFERATQDAGRLKGTQQQEAMLIAGLSAHALNRNAEAIRWLRPLSEGRDPVLVGKASASLGLIAQERGEHEDAARHLLIAGEKLQGDEAARASMYAGDSFRSLGKKDDAARAYERAQTQVLHDGGLRIMIGDRINANANAVATNAPVTTPTRPTTAPSTLTVQVGVWSNQTTAQRQAQKVASKGQVRIVPILKDGRRLYAVRVGRFSNRDAAERVKNIIGGTAVVTVASGE